jgi:hypothetical protein
MARENIQERLPFRVRPHDYQLDGITQRIGQPLYQFWLLWVIKTPPWIHQKERFSSAC